MENEGVFNHALSRVRSVRFLDDFPFSLLVCLQCDSPACVKSCEVNAIFKEAETGIVKIDDAKCTKCLKCVDACPYGGVSYVEHQDKIMKCELCEGDPECVKACPNGALSFNEITFKDLKNKIKRASMIKKLMCHWGLYENTKNTHTKNFSK
jgi:Fe-S-cluster-containing dehydrogenase component